MGMTRCSYCGMDNIPEVKRCTNCKTPLLDLPASKESEDTPSTIIIPPSNDDLAPEKDRGKPFTCPFCKAPLRARDMVFCTKCGNKLDDAAIDDKTTPATSRPSLDFKRGVYIILLDENNEDSESIFLEHFPFHIGRNQGDLQFKENQFLSELHVRFDFEKGDIFINDLDSDNGIFYKIHDECELNSGDFIYIGEQVLKFEVIPSNKRRVSPASFNNNVVVFGTPETSRLFRIIQFTEAGVSRNVYYPVNEETILGRNEGDIVFPHDRYMSRRQSSVYLKGSKFYIRDLGSKNGTMVRYRGKKQLMDQDCFMLGGLVFRLDFK